MSTTSNNDEIILLKQKLYEAQAQITELERNNILIAKSCEEHVQELEKELFLKEKKLSEAIEANLQIINSAEQHIQELEIELHTAIEKEKKLKGDNIEIAKSAADHVNELMSEIIDLKKKQEANHKKQIYLEKELTTSKEDNRNSLAEIPLKETNIKKIEIKSRQGYLSKKSPSSLLFVKIWQKRYFVLKDQGQISYWKDYNDYNSGKKYKGTLFLSDVQIPNRNYNSIRPSDSMLRIQIFDRAYELDAGSKEEADIWAQCILKHWS
jgi:hypothetical protein